MKENKYRAKQKILSFVNAHQTRYPEDEEVQAILKPAVLEYITESLLEISNSVVYSLDASHILCEDINIPNDELDKSYPLEFDFVIEPEPHYNSQIDMPEGMYILFITWLNPNVEYHSFFYGLRSLLNNERNFGEVAILRFQDMWQILKSNI